MARRLTQEEFLEKAIEVHGSRFDYSKTEYINTRQNIIIICKKHGDFTIKPDNHIAGQGCAACARENHRLTEITADRLDRLIKVHSGKYRYPSTMVDGGKIKVMCDIHGEFTQSIHLHEYGHGCPSCARTSKKPELCKVCRTCGESRVVSMYRPRFKTCNMCLESDSPVHTTRVCSSCGIEKSLDSFSKRKGDPLGVRKDCKECKSKVESSYKKVYRKENRERINEYGKAYHKARLVTDEVYRAKVIARDVVRKAITKMGYTKGSRTEEILGCSFLDFKTHMESRFKEGMGWHNRGEWHVDHKVPLSSGRTEAEVLALNHYSNLQPLWGAENMAKSDSMPI